MAGRQTRRVLDALAQAAPAILSPGQAPAAVASALLTGAAEIDSIRKKAAATTTNAELTIYARQYSHEAIDAIRAIMHDDGAPKNVRLQAAEMLLERAHGKVKEQLDIAVEAAAGKDPRDMTIEELERIAALGLRAGAELDRTIDVRTAVNAPSGLHNHENDSQ